MLTNKKEVTLQLCIMCAKRKVVVEMTEGKWQALRRYFQTKEIEPALLF